MSIPTRKNVATMVRAAVQSKQAITFGPPAEDKEHPEITWQCYGLIPSNEIAVIARCGDVEIGACRKSPLLVPVMADRIFGMDVADEEVAMRLSEEIWSSHAEQLLAAAQSCRQ